MTVTAKPSANDAPDAPLAMSGKFTVSSWTRTPGIELEILPSGESAVTEPSLYTSMAKRAVSPGSRTPFPLPQPGGVSSTVTASNRRLERAQVVALSIRTLSIPNSVNIEPGSVSKAICMADVGGTNRARSNSARCQPWRPEVSKGWVVRNSTTGISTVSVPLVICSLNSSVARPRLWTQ